MCDIDLSAELEDMKNLLREKLAKEALVYGGKFNCLVYAMEKFLESNKRYLALEEKLGNIEEKIEIIKANHEEDC